MTPLVRDVEEDEGGVEAGGAVWFLDQRDQVLQVVDMIREEVCDEIRAEWEGSGWMIGWMLDDDDDGGAELGSRCPYKADMVGCGDHTVNAGACA